VMMILIVLTESSVPDAIKCIMTRLGFVFLPLSVLWVKYYPQLGRVLTLSWTEDPVGVATQKNSLGELCDFMGVVLLWRFRRAYNDRGDRKRTWRLLAIGSVLVMAVWLLWSCNSMTSACALSMATIVLLASNRPVFRRKTSLIHVLIAGLLAITIYGLFFQSSGGLIATLGKDPTLTGRTDIWRAVLSVPNSRLVGAGYESFWLGSRLSILWQAFANFHLQEAHSGYVELFLNLGWIGIGLLGALIALGYRKVMCSYRRDADFGSLRIALFLAVIVTGLTEAAFRMMSAPWLMFLLATITPAPTRRKAVSVHEMEHSEAPPDTYITIPEETVSGF
jgi:exopolysaccharide production protein ExoQ